MTCDTVESGTPCANACVILRRGDETSVFVSSRETDNCGTCSFLLPESTYIAEADAKGGCLAIPSRLRVTGPCSMALMLCPPVPADCARIVVNAAKGA